MILANPNGGLDCESLNSARRALNEQGYTVVDALYTSPNLYQELMDGGAVSMPLAYVAKALEELSSCSAMYCINGWQDSKACRIIRSVAEQCGIIIVGA